VDDPEEALVVRIGVDIRCQGIFQVPQGFRFAAAFVLPLQLGRDVGGGVAVVHETLGAAPAVFFTLLPVPRLALFRTCGEVFCALHDEVDGAFDLSHVLSPSFFASQLPGFHLLRGPEE
jgi:hypothetical protein